MPHPDRNLCVCRGRGAYVVVSEDPSLGRHAGRFYDAVKDVFRFEPIPTTLVPCPYHSLDGALSRADIEMLKDAGIA